MAGKIKRYWDRTFSSLFSRGIGETSYVLTYNSDESIMFTRSVDEKTIRNACGIDNLE